MAGKAGGFDSTLIEESSYDANQEEDRVQALSWLDAATIAAICTGLGALIPKLLESLGLKKKTDLGTKLQERDYVISEYQKLISKQEPRIEKLEKLISSLRDKYDVLQQEHLRCREESGILSERLRIAETRVTELEERP